MIVRVCCWGKEGQGGSEGWRKERGIRRTEVKQRMVVEFR